MSKTCNNCGGLIAEGAMGYSGKLCLCLWKPITSESIEESMNNFFDKYKLDRIRIENELLKERSKTKILSEALEFAKFVLTDRECSSDQTGHLLSEWKSKMSLKIKEALKKVEELDK